MYNNDYSISQSFDPLEEERKRKEQELAQLQMGQIAQPVSPEQIGQLPTPGEPTQVAGPMTQPVPPQMPQMPQQADVRRIDNQLETLPNSGGTVVATPQAKGVIAQNTVPFSKALADSQNDQKKMWEIYNNSEYSSEQRQIAGSQLSDMMRQEYEKNKATQYIRSATPEDLNKMLNSRSQEGSWAKAIMYGLLGMENSAKDEAAKLGIGAKWQTQQIFDPKTGETNNVLYKVRADGLPMEGYNSETGKALSSKELAGLAGGGQKLDLVGGTYVNDKTGEVGRVVSDKNTGQSWIQTSTGRKSMAGFRPQSSTGTLEDMRVRKIQEINLALQGKTQEEKMRILRAYNSDLVAAGQSPIQPTEIGLAAPQIGVGAGRTGVSINPAPQAAPTLTPQPAAATATPQEAAPGTGLGGRPTGAELGARKKVIESAAKEVAGSADTQNMLNSIDKTIGVIDSGAHNLGHVAGGLTQGELTGENAQRWGERFRTTDAKNTKLVMDTVNKLAADGLKALGSNPSTTDLEFWTRYKPDINSDPAFVKEWIQSRSQDLKRRLGYAEKQMSAGGGAGAAPSVNQGQWRVVP